MITFFHRRAQIELSPQSLNEKVRPVIYGTSQIVKNWFQAEKRIHSPGKSARPVFFGHSIDSAVSSNPP